MSERVTFDYSKASCFVGDNEMCIRDSFKDTEFAGEFPFAEMDFRDEYFPGHVKLRAFNPFIPQNDRDSSLPAAFFEIEFENTTDKVLDYTAYFSVNNLLPFGTTRRCV